jgi:hypothetical protein
VFAASTAIMAPFNATNISVVVTSITGTGQRNQGTVLWSQTNGHGTAHAVGSPITVGNPAQLGADDAGLLPTTCTGANLCSLILAEVSYNYTSPYGKFIVGTLKMSDTFYTKPRRTISVACTDCP